MSAEAVAMGLQTLGNTLGGAYGGGQQAAAGKGHIINPYQMKLIQGLQLQAAQGGGDFGFGSLARQGTSQLQQAMADRGISVANGGGMYGGALANALMQASAGDVQNRRDYTMGVAQLSPAVMNTTGWDPDQKRWGKNYQSDMNQIMGAYGMGPGVQPEQSGNWTGAASGGGIGSALSSGGQRKYGKQIMGLHF